MGINIIGLGSCLLGQGVNNKELIQKTGIESTPEIIKGLSGIESRYFLNDNQATSDLAIQAAENALNDAQLFPEDIDLIICATATPDYGVFPATACLVGDKLGVIGIPAFDLGAGCSGFVYGIVTAQAFIESGIYQTVLVIGADALSRITNFQDKGTCILLADGGGAVILRAVQDENKGIIATYLGADGSNPELLFRPAGGSRELIAKEPANNYLQMQGRPVFMFAVPKMAESAIKVMEKANLKMADVDWIIPHQANLRIIQSIAKKLATTSELSFEQVMAKMVVTIDHHGNTSSASIPLAWDEKYKEGQIKKGDLILLVAFGAGLTWGAVLLRW